MNVPADVTWPIRHPKNLYRNQQERPCDYCGRLYHPWSTAKPARCCSRECFGRLLSRQAMERRPRVELGPMQLARAAEIAAEMLAALAKAREADR